MKLRNDCGCFFVRGKGAHMSMSGNFFNFITLGHPPYRSSNPDKDENSCTGSEPSSFVARYERGVELSRKRVLQLRGGVYEMP